MAAYNPPVPFSVPLGQLRSNDLIFVNGISSHGSFAINLKTDGGDTALHFNPRFNERQVVRNAKIGGSWGAEERHGGFPFIEGQPFEVIILVTDFQYKVAINGVHYTEFNHRSPKEAVRHLAIKGDVVLQSVRYPSSNVTMQPFGQATYPGFQVAYSGGLQSYPGGQPSYPGGQPSYPGGQPSYPGGQPSYPGGQPSYPGGRSSPRLSNSSCSNSPPLGQFMQPPTGHFVPPPSSHFIPPPAGHFAPPPLGQFIPPPFGQTPGFSMSFGGFAQPPTDMPFAPVYNPPTPYTGPIAGGLYPGRTIRISGTPIGNRFTINLHCGPSQGENIAFHFDARINVGGDHNVVVRNSFISGGWGGEERHQSFFPFQQNAPFDLNILAEVAQFKVFVNGQHFADFNYRLPLASVDFLNVSGDVRVTSIIVQ